MISTRTLAILLLIAVSLPGCGGDDPVSPPVGDPGPPMVRHTFRVGADQYLNNRFYRLDLPRREPQGRTAGENILLSSIKVFERMPPGPLEPADILNVAAYVDSSGFRDWNPTAMDFFAPAAYGPVWREISGFQPLLDRDGNLTALNFQLALVNPDSGLVAVVYTVVDASGSVVGQVGDVPGLALPSQALPGESGLFYRMKLLKVAPAGPRGYVDSYVLRNIYSLGNANIDRASFELRIEATGPDIEQPEVDESGIPYLRLFGLDVENPAREPGADGLVDVHDPLRFDLRRGLLFFPSDFPAPFNATEDQYSQYADSPDFSFATSTYLASNLVPEIYDPATPLGEFADYRRFSIVVSYLRYDLSGEDLDEVPLNRTDWTAASAPLHSGLPSDWRRFEPNSRVEANRWFPPRDSTLRRYLEPDLTGAAGDETQPTLDLYLRPDSGTWAADNWGGIMTGVGRVGADLTGYQALEIWVNDGRADRDRRTGKLHIDFGDINEDGFWPLHEGALVVGTYQDEDADQDGIWIAAEDVGLDGTGEPRYATDWEVAGDSPYPLINATAGNGRWDHEDVNGNGRLDLDNRYHTLTIDLAETTPAVDVVYDYENVADLIQANIAWRRYQVNLADALSVTDSGEPDLSWVRHLRIWYEDGNPGAAKEPHLQLSGFRFLR